MDVADFHAKLLGIDQDKTPEDFRLNPYALLLYRSHADHDKRGFRGTPKQVPCTVATIVLALSMAHESGEFFPVVLAVPYPVHDHVMHWLNQTARCVFRQRKGQVEVVRFLKKVWEQPEILPRQVMQMPEPPRWVAFGYDAGTPGPAWVEGRLVGDA